MSCRLTPSTSRQSGWMSRGTARSIRSRGRPSRAAITSAERLALDHVVGRAGRGDDDVGLLHLRRQLLEADGAAAEALGEPDRPVVAAVGDERGLDAARGERSGGQLRRLAGAHHQDEPAGEIAKRPLRQLHRDRGHRHALLGDPGLRSRPLAGGERAAEQPVEDRPGRPLDQRQLVGALHLALDLGLADDHRVEPRGHPEQVVGAVGWPAASRGGRPAPWGGSPPRGRAPRAPATRPRRRRGRPGRARCGCRSRSRPPRAPPAPRPAP